MRTAGKNVVLLLALPGTVIVALLAMVIALELADELDIPPILVVPLTGVATVLFGLFIVFRNFRDDRYHSGEVFLALVGSTGLSLGLLSLAAMGLARAGGALALPVLL